MMFLFWKYWRGWVVWKTEGGFPERFLNLAAKRGIFLQPIHREEEWLWGECFACDYRRLRPIAKTTGVRLRIEKRHGLPFRKKHLRSRLGLPVGTILAIILLQLLSRAIWSVEVTGNQTVPSAEIKQVMAELGVDIGSSRTGFDLRQIQLQAIEKLPALSWLAVNLDGSIAHIEVKERLNATPPPDLSQPTNLKAAYRGRILSTQIKEGQVMVKPGDAVVEGMLLASGIVETKNGTLLRHARGEVLAETERTFQTVVPFQRKEWKPEGKRIVYPSLQLFGKSIPLFANRFWPNAYRKETKRYPLYIRETELPIGITFEHLTALSEQAVTLSVEKAKSIAADELNKWKKTHLKQATVTKEEPLVTIAATGYTLQVRFCCVENIAVEEPILIKP